MLQDPIFSLLDLLNVITQAKVSADKAWGCLLGQQLSERDIIVACIDYRYVVNVISMTSLAQERTKRNHAKQFVFLGIVSWLCLISVFMITLFTSI
jgi:hypothetical protein